MLSYLWPMTSLCPVLVGYRLVSSGPCTCLPSMYVQNLPVALSSAVVWRLACISCHSFFDLLCELLFDFPLLLELIFICYWALHFFRPISWLPSFPAILLCHSCPNDSILLSIFRSTVYSFLQWFNMAIGFPTYELLCPFYFFSWASLAHLLPIGFLIPFTNSAFPWAITNFIGLPWPNYFILILRVLELAINPLLSLFALLLGLWVCYFSLSGLL